MPFPNRIFDPNIHQLTREDYPRVFDMITAMNDPLPKNQFALPLPESSRTFDASGLPTARQSLLLPPGIVQNSVLGRAGASLVQFAPRQGEVQMVATDLSKCAGWGNTPAVEPLTPPNVMLGKRLSGKITVSTQLWRTAPILAASLLESQLHAALAAALDLGALAGSGTGNEPLGIFNNPDVGTVVGPVTLAKIAALEKGIATAFCETSALGVVVAPDVRERMRTTYENGTGSASIWNALSDMNRQQSPHCPDQSAVVGDFSQLFIGLWGDIMVSPNPYSLDKEGKIQLLMEVSADITILRSGAFGTIKPAA